jgi:hypothetical protein
MKTDDSELLKLNQPGVAVEVDPKTAAELGAVEEDALTEAEARESAEAGEARH